MQFFIKSNIFTDIFADTLSELTFPGDGSDISNGQKCSFLAKKNAYLRKNLL